MIKLSNKESFKFMVASGALAFDGKGWFHERLLVQLGFIDPSLFAVVLKSLTLEPRKGNLRWWHPWTCIRLLRHGSVNAVGLTNPGAEAWLSRTSHKIDYDNTRIIISLVGSAKELVTMVKMFNHIPIMGYEINLSCPNTREDFAHNTAESIKAVKAVRAVSNHPVGIKLSYDQDYFSIAKGLEGIAEWVSINSVRWGTVFPGRRSPVHKYGGGGVSGEPAQSYNWHVARILRNQCNIPVVWPSVMNRNDFGHVLEDEHADAVSFGAIHFLHPCRPTALVRRAQRDHQGEFDEDFEKYLQGR